jgi:hypothetical protein
MELIRGPSQVVIFFFGHWLVRTWSFFEDEALHQYVLSFRNIKRSIILGG